MIQFIDLATQQKRIKTKIDARIPMGWMPYWNDATNKFKSFVLIFVASMLLFVSGVFADEKVTPIKFPYINDSMINIIKKNPQAIIQYYQQDSGVFKKDLGSKFSKLNEDGLKLAFSSILAYRTAPFGNSKATDPKSILQSKFLNCGNYTLLTYNYFHLLAPQSAVEINFVGWNGGTIGNHEQIFTTKTGLPMLLDPTVGLIASTTFNHVAAGKPIAESNIISAYSRNDIDSFSKNVQLALITGLYKPSDLLYFFYGAEQAYAQSLNDNWATPQHTPLLKALAQPISSTTKTSTK